MPVATATLSEVFFPYIVKCTCVSHNFNASSSTPFFSFPTMMAQGNLGLNVVQSILCEVFSKAKMLILIFQ
ncbi:hypothetical protein Q787_00720 [Ornithobacterium rhinotracheale H06-030791]|nr:hypothetical protein Q787_00720 [Ornithobacterium rhinotracheale H06-030791]